MTGDIVILFGAALFGVLVGCQIFKYEIPLGQKIAAPLAFAGLNAVVPMLLPFGHILIPLAAMWFVLQYNMAERGTANRVFAVALLITMLGVAVVYSV